MRWRPRRPIPWPSPSQTRRRSGQISKQLWVSLSPRSSAAMPTAFITWCGMVLPPAQRDGSPAPMSPSSVRMASALRWALLGRAGSPRSSATAVIRLQARPEGTPASTSPSQRARRSVRPYPAWSPATSCWPTGSSIPAYNAGGYGYYVMVDHGNGMVTLYAHNSKLLVQAGDTVEAGDVLSLSGSTGRSTGPHLHFEVRINGQRVNPRSYLPT